jgi:hypothetical protein
MAEQDPEPHDSKPEKTAEPVFDYPLPELDIEALPPDDPLVRLRRANEELRAIRT